MSREAPHSTNLPDQYIDVLVAPFTAGIIALEAAEPTMTTQPDKLDNHIRPYLTQSAIKGELNKTDWDQFDLEWREIDGRTLKPPQFAERLITFAYDDALFMMNAGITFLNSSGIEDDDTVKTTLLRSAKQLLETANLGEYSKAELHHYLSATILKGSTSRLYDTSIPTDLHKKSDPFSLTETSDDCLVIQWNEHVKQWIDKHAEKANGCPAHKTIVEINGKKQILTHAFWKMLIHAAYPDNADTVH